MIVENLPDMVGMGVSKRMLALSWTLPSGYKPAVTAGKSQAAICNQPDGGNEEGWGVFSEMKTPTPSEARTASVLVTK